MAKERVSSAFKGLLAGVDFMKNLQEDREEDQRYEEQKTYRDQEFNWRKEQAKIAANQWNRNFERKADEFDKNYGLAKEGLAFQDKKLAIDDENMDLARGIEEKAVNARMAYTNAMKSNLDLQTSERDKLEALKEKLSTYDDKFKSLTESSYYKGIPISDKEALDAYYNQKDAPNPLMSLGKLAFGGSNIEEARAYTNKLEAQSKVEWTEKKINEAEKVFKQIRTDKDSGIILNSPGAEVLLRMLKGNLSDVMQKAKDGLITDRESLKKIARMKALIFQYDNKVPDNAAYSESYQKELGKGKAGLEIDAARQQYVEEGYLEE